MLAARDVDHRVLLLPLRPVHRNRFSGIEDIRYIGIGSSDVDPDSLYPDPQNLMNTNPNPFRIQVDKITKLISTGLLILKKKTLFQICT